MTAGHRGRANVPYFERLMDSLDRDPTNHPGELDGHMHFGYWDAPSSAAPGAGDIHRAVDRLCAEVASAAQVENGLKILDVGCGMGGTLEWLDRRFTGLELSGVNIDKNQLEWARRRIDDGRSGDGNPSGDGNRIELFEADACRLPFEDNSFDLVLAIECIFHFASREQFFREAYRVLRPGGRLVLSDFLPVPWLVPWLESGLWIFRGIYGHLDFSYSLQAYRRLAERTPLTIERERDITVNTLPSYRHFERVMCHLNRSPLERWLIRSGFCLSEWYSRQGMLRYMILAFQS